jgi:hypothetical protein
VILLGCVVVAVCVSPNSSQLASKEDVLSATEELGRVI